MDVAKRTGLTQARLSRAENGNALLTPDEVGQLGRLYAAPEEQLADLVQLAQAAQAGYVDARVVLQGGATANLQRRFATLERNASEVRAFQPAMVLGVLQTADYASVVFDTDPQDSLVAERLRRQRRLLEDHKRRWVLIQTEGSLRWHARSPELMARQIDHIIELSRLPNVELGVIDWATTISVFPSTAFHLYDRTTAVVGTNDGIAIMTDARAVADYRTLFDQLRAAADFGHDARATLARIAVSYRSMPSR